MTSAEIRQSFLDFFRSKEHTLVPSASLLPQSPGLLFTNAGMNQFVPYFLGTQKAPFTPARAADTQKCIRAGGKHNDLEDVGYDSYHHTLFEMLGNWSFGDYFKAEAISWAWELLVERWGFPPERLYATVYRPAEGDPGQFDGESHAAWSKLFQAKGLDPALHVVDGNVKDNFWMMGETGPCGPCSELHFDLTEAGDTQGKLVNADSDRCIELWNLVFIQYNAEEDGSFRELPAKHVDTGMGFERIASVMKTTQQFSQFGAQPSNYATDVFTPLFAKLEELCGQAYGDLYPEPETALADYSEGLKRDVALRVIADHIRTLSLSIADGILPGNTGRNYVLRRILRRAVRYGRQLGFDGSKTFLPALSEAVVNQLGEVFPELQKRSQVIAETLQREEQSFNETLDRGLARLEQEQQELAQRAESSQQSRTLSGEFAFQLYDTFGFPIDLTQLLARERGLSVDMPRFEELMEAQRERARAAAKSSVVKALNFQSEVITQFTGYEQDESEAQLLEVHHQDEWILLITDCSPFYAEMGGQQADQGMLKRADGTLLPIAGVQAVGEALAHLVAVEELAKFAEVKPFEAGETLLLSLETSRRRGLETHHTATHLLHWALHEEVSQEATQQGSLVAPDRLRFDFTSAALTAEQIVKIEEKVNAAIAQNSPISITEVAHESIREREDIEQFFGDKYGEFVRVVQIGGEEGSLDGYSMELCGGTHRKTTGELGLFKIKSEGAISSGVRRIEALCDQAAQDWWQEQIELANRQENELEAKISETNEALIAQGAEPIAVPQFPRVMEALLVESGDFTQVNNTWLAYQRHLEELERAQVQADKVLKKLAASQAASQADTLLSEKLTELGERGQGSSNLVLHAKGQAPLLQELLNSAKKRQLGQTLVFIIEDENRLHLGVHCGEAAQKAGQKAGEWMREIAPIAGGKGGGKADQARGAAPDCSKAQELLEVVKNQLGAF